MNYKFVSTAIITALAAASMAKPLVSYTVTGTSGDYNLDFTVTNNLNTGEDIYFFGVQLSAPGITNSPGSFNSTVWSTWNNSPYGGSNITYNNNWIDLSYSSLLPGNTLGGFDVHDTDSVAPTSVNWFAYGYFGSPYTGGDNFYTPYNPGFEGAAQAVPEPMPMAAMGLGLIGLAVRRRRR